MISLMPSKLRAFPNESSLQLSITVGSITVNTAEQVPASVSATTETGQVMTGASLSSTVTEKLQLSDPSEFVAVAVTVVRPTEKLVPGS